MKFRTKPVEIDAFRFTGTNHQPLWLWTEGYFKQVPVGHSLHGTEFTGLVYDKLHATWIGVIPGQWIVCGVKGEFYPCDDETFHWKYEEVK